MIVAGIGCRRGTPAAAIAAAIEAALERAGLVQSALAAIATAAIKHDEPGIAAAADSLGVRLVVVSQPELATAGSRVSTHSDRVFERTGVGSVAEAAALAAGGPGARLLVSRVVVGPATCALASTDAAS